MALTLGRPRERGDVGPGGLSDRPAMNRQHSPGGMTQGSSGRHSCFLNPPRAVSKWVV